MNHTPHRARIDGAVYVRWNQLIETVLDYAARATASELSYYDADRLEDAAREIRARLEEAKSV